MESVDEFIYPSLRRSNYKVLSNTGHEFSRIYHWHIRKCAGTGLNLRFISSACDWNLEEAKNIKSVVHRSGGRAEHNGKVFVSWNKRILESGNYFYGFSHFPCHLLNLPENTFTLTTLRDPVQRVISHYKMISEYKSKKIDHPCMRVEGRWLGDSGSLSEFVSNMPKNHLCAQVYHFSSSFSIDEAYEKISTVNFVSRVEDLDSKGFNELNKTIPALNFAPGKVRVSSHPKKLITSDEIHHLRELLDVEYRFLRLCHSLCS